MTDFELRQQQLMRDRDRYASQRDYRSPQGQMVGNVYVAPNALQYIAEGLRAFGGQRGEQLANQGMAYLRREKQQMMGNEMKALTQALRGREAITMPEGMAGPVSPAQPGSIDAFYQRAAESPLSEFQQVGMQGQLDQAKLAQQRAQRQQQMQAISGMTPQQAISAGYSPEQVKQFFEAKNIGRNKAKMVDIGGRLVPVDEFGNIVQDAQALDKTGNPFSDLLVRGPGGQIVQNAPLVSAKAGIARAGASKNITNVNMPDKKFYEGLGTAVSGQIESAYNQAQSAVQTLNNANQIAQSLDKAIVGPGANQRVALAQIGQVLGVGGKDNVEVLQNTRNVIQGLARQELSAAGQMKGQGQITESERAILRKAEAGQINEFTKPELQEFIGAIRKTAKSRVQTHQQNLQRLQGDPQASTLVDYLNISAPADYGAAAPARTPGGVVDFGSLQ